MEAKIKRKSKQVGAAKKAVRASRSSSTRSGSPVAARSSSFVRQETGAAKLAQMVSPPPGAAVPSRVTPSELWSHASTPLDRALAERGKLEDAIQKRVGWLDKLWGRLRLRKRETILSGYARDGGLPRAAASQVTAALKKADGCKAEIAALADRARRLKRAGTLDGPGSGGLTMREEIRTEINAIRSREKEAVLGARRVIDDQGMKLDFLAKNESAIDPTIKPEDSLLGMLEQWVRLTDLIESFQSWLRRSEERMKEDSQEWERLERHLDEVRKTDVDKKRRLQELDLQLRRKQPS